MSKKSKKQRKAENLKRIAREQQERRDNPPVRTFITPIKETTPQEQLPDTYIVNPAIRIGDTNEVYHFPYALSHADIIHELLRMFAEIGGLERLDTPYTEGFIDNHGNFLDRHEAGEIAYNARQLKYGEEGRYCLQSYQYNRLYPQK